MSDLRTYLDINGKMVVPWETEDGMIIHLITPEDYRKLPLGTKLYSILGEFKTKTESSNDPKDPNYIDQDIRFGRLAFGVKQ